MTRRPKASTAIGRWVRERRTARALSQADAAREVEVHVGTWTAWEGGRQTPGWTHLRRLAAWAGVEIGSLVTICDTQ